uniref:Alpha-2-macroglobulin-like protein 1 n=1 Tax=Gadus morhua TaxID=8049 RepID=A0A8C5CVR5_GADMO
MSPCLSLDAKDPNRNRIAQWLDRAAVSGILDLSHPMSPEAAQGPYTITAWTEKGESTSRSFDILEYVLPKYAVNIRLPNVINILQQEVPIQICGRYTYGKPVLGTIKVVVCREGQGHFVRRYPVPQEDLCVTSQLQAKRQSFVHGERLPAYPSAVLTMRPFYSKSKSFVKISANGHKSLCEGESQVGAQYIIQGEELRLGQEELPFYYTVMSKGAIMRHGHLPVAVKEGIVNKGVLSIPLLGKAALSPYAQVVVYTLMPSGEVLADNKDFPVDQCFENRVKLEFSADRELPGGEASFRLESQPGSLCSVRAVDQSILLLQPDQELSASYVRSHTLTKDIDSIPGQPDVKQCLTDMPDTENHLHSGSGSRHRGNRQKIETVRSYFPDTWIWELIPVGDSGSVSVVKTLPDTITSWRAQAFCTSSSLGFGLSRDTALVAFQPFFVSLTLPYSVVRGEVFTLRATVFNYLPSCIMVGLSVLECADCQYTMCVCAEESRVFQWEVSPSSLGEVTLEVRAEALHTEQLCGNEVAPPPTVGRVDTVVHDGLMEVNPENPAEKNISLLLPDLFVAGSARASFSVLGDLMGRAMKNLDKLLAMPYGCGEQNMILFAPNIYILNYLTSTAQLTHAIKERATRFLESGYQRELTYRHDDGSYSAFGKSDASGNTWLTAFVMKSFGGAKPYIFIDPKLIVDSRTWLLSHRRQDGCITSVGKLFQNGMKGGVSDDVSLTAYITAALLELDAVNPMVSGCLQCLRVAVAGKLENMYTTALLSYTFTLAGDQQTRAALLTALHQRSVTDGGTRHWKRAEASEKVLDSLEVEMTAYVLLAVLSGPPVPGFDLDYASSITRWLIQQQNPYGGFASTQDTVVALQALARYGAATYSSEGACMVGLSSLGGASWQFTVDQSTRLLYQEQALDRLPGDYRITAQGQGCVQAQVGPPGAELCTSTGLCPGPGLYQGRRKETNMVIINLKLLSGYGLQQSTLQEVKSSVKRVDFEEGYINIYLDGLKKEVLRSYSVTLEEEEAVRNLRPAVVKVYDYYQTSDEAVADYSSPCAERKYTQFNHAQLKLAKVPA